MINKKYIKPVILEKKVVNKFFSLGNDLLACICNDCWACACCSGCAGGPASQYCNCNTIPNCP